MVAAVVVATAVVGTSDVVVAEAESSTVASFATRPSAALPTLREGARGCLDGSPCEDLPTAGGHVDTGSGGRRRKWRLKIGKGK